MTKILYINPVGHDRLDEATREWIESVRSGEVEVQVCSLESGPSNLEYYVYEHEVLTPMLRRLRIAEAEGYHAAVIGCFYDGGLREARESFRMPVIGMAESTLAYASTLGHKFSIIVGRRKWIRKMEENVILYGHSPKLASMRIVGMSIEQMEEDQSLFFDRCIEEAQLAIDNDGAEVVVLSEYTSAKFWARAKAEVTGPVSDSGVIAWKAAEMAASLYDTVGYSHSKVGGYEAPPDDGRDIGHGSETDKQRVG